MVVKGVELEVEATVEDKMVGAATVEMRVGAAARGGLWAGEARVEATVAVEMARSTK